MEVVAITLVMLARSKTVDAVTGICRLIVGEAADAVEREHLAFRRAHRRLRPEKPAPQSLAREWSTLRQTEDAAQMRSLEL